VNAEFCWTQITGFCKGDYCNPRSTPKRAKGQKTNAFSMKVGKTSLLLGLLALFEAQAASSKTDPAPEAAFDPKSVRVFPFSSELSSKELKSTTAGMPDVLAVSRTSEKVRILGTRFQKGPFNVMKQSISSVGKLALLPPICVGGSLLIKELTANANFVAAVEMEGNILNSQIYALRKGVKYTWALEVEDERTTLKIKDRKGNVVNEVNGTGPRPISGVAVTGVGFASTCSRSGEKVDLEFTYTAPK